MTLETLFKRVCGMCKGEIERQCKEIKSLEGQGCLFDSDINKIRAKNLREETTRMASFLVYVQAYGKGKANVQAYTPAPKDRPF